MDTSTETHSLTEHIVRAVVLVTFVPLMLSMWLSVACPRFIERYNLRYVLSCYNLSPTLTILARFIVRLTILGEFILPLSLAIGFVFLVSLEDIGYFLLDVLRWLCFIIVVSLSPLPKWL